MIDVSTGFSGLATERLEAELCGMAANIAAATCRWLEMVAEYDRRQAWVSWECRSMTHWLVGHVGMARSTAREHVRVANALTTLPMLRAEFGAGRLSYSRVRTVSRVATPSNEEGLLSVALAATAPQLERWVNAIERAHMANDPDAADQIFESRSVSYTRDDNGAWVARMRLPPEIGALLENLIRDEVDASRAAETETGPRDEGLTMQQRRADAFAVIVERAAQWTGHETAFPDPGRAESGRHTKTGTAAHMVRPARKASKRHPHRTRNGDAKQPLIVVHRYPDGAELKWRPLPITTARLACDSCVITLDHDLDGSPLNFGLTRRTPTAAQRRAVAARDRCCRFPGCNTRKGLHLHHVKYWHRDKGLTNLENLIYLCARHHRAIHDRGWNIVGLADGQLDFIAPHRTGPPRPTTPTDLDDLIAHLTDPTGPIRPTAGAGERFDLEMAVWAHFHNEHVMATRNAAAQAKSASTEAPPIDSDLTI